MLFLFIDKQGATKQILEAVRAIHENCRASVRVNGVMSDWFQIALLYPHGYLVDV